ncbi:hypothetical protein QBC38DRAFT_499115 [Podospora fimiseda]|uniref:Uncharacterized protein n=1 Tax=Podospora fimiseda TaxID=252190 RepID=A0AAN7BQU1_9PEZI|nr:hypothetical protein QBC38DRAFT_499115 [Podospora fimiseda]
MDFKKWASNVTAAVECQKANPRSSPPSDDGWDDDGSDNGWDDERTPPAPPPNVVHPVCVRLQELIRFKPASQPQIHTSSEHISPIQSHHLTRQIDIKVSDEETIDPICFRLKQIMAFKPVPRTQVIQLLTSSLAAGLGRQKSEEPTRPPTLTPPRARSNQYDSNFVGDTWLKWPHFAVRYSRRRDEVGDDPAVLSLETEKDYEEYKNRKRILFNRNWKRKGLQ